MQAEKSPSVQTHTASMLGSEQAYRVATLVCKSGWTGTRRSRRVRKAGAGSMSRAPDHTLLSSRVASMVCNRPMAAQGTYTNHPTSGWSAAQRLQYGSCGVPQTRTSGVKQTWTSNSSLYHRPVSCTVLQTWLFNGLQGHKIGAHGSSYMRRMKQLMNDELDCM